MRRVVSRTAIVCLYPLCTPPEQIGTTYNVLPNVEVAPAGKVVGKPPLSRSGDYIELRAEMNMVCGLTSCSAENSNNGTFKPIDYEIIRRPCCDR